MKRKSAFFVALDEIQQQQQPVQESPSETASLPPTPSSVRAQQEGAGDRSPEKPSSKKSYFEKASIYLDEIHTYKLQDIVVDYRRTHKQKMNRQEIIRRLLERLSKDEIMHIISD